jgi:hypothetical protein
VSSITSPKGSGIPALSAQLPHDPSKKNVVVVGTGSGWGSTAFLKKLDTSENNVTVISPRNFFFFTLLLLFAKCRSRYTRYQLYLAT